MTDKRSKTQVPAAKKADVPSQAARPAAFSAPMAQGHFANTPLNPPSSSPSTSSSPQTGEDEDKWQVVQGKQRSIRRSQKRVDALKSQVDGIAPTRHGKIAVAAASETDSATMRAAAKTLTLSADRRDTVIQANVAKGASASSHKTVSHQKRADAERGQAEALNHRADATDLSSQTHYPGLGPASAPPKKPTWVKK